MESKQLSELFKTAAMKTEQKRIQLFVLILGIGLLFSALNLGLNRKDVVGAFQSAESYYFIMGGIFIYLSYWVLLYFTTKRMHKKGKTMSTVAKIVQVTVEVSFPTIVIGVLSYVEATPVFIDSPVFLFYFILIALSALHLNLYMCIYTSLVAAIQYSVIVYTVFEAFPAEASEMLFFPRSIYFGRGFIFIGTGLAAGFITIEINNYIREVSRQLKEKQKVVTLFGQQVSREVVDELIAEESGNAVKMRDASILFLDIRNFTTYVESKEPVEIIQFQNNIFSPLMEIIEEHGGIINQVLGDGFMASFGVPVSKPAHCRDAFLAGKAIIVRLNELAEKGIIPPTRVGIGLHCGEVITGNIGNAIRKQYSIAGTTVILAARLEQLNKAYNSQFLLSKAAHDRLEGLQSEMDSIGKVPLKGFEEPVEVFQVKV